MGNGANDNGSSLWTRWIVGILFSVLVFGVGLGVAQLSQKVDTQYYDREAAKYDKEISNLEKKLEKLQVDVTKILIKLGQIEVRLCAAEEDKDRQGEE